MSFKSNDGNGLLESFSDDQLYTSERRKSILPNNNSHISNIPYQNMKENDFENIKTSHGKPVLRKKIIEIEGDGPLGIIFTDKNGLMCISKIIKDSVASEYFELQVGMTVIQINNIDCRDKTYFKSMECLGNLWRENSCITLHFEYENPIDIINNPIHNPIYKFLEGIDCEDYYGDFSEIGATDLEDLKFIEYDDLIKMKMPILKRRKLQEILLGECKTDIYKSELNIYFNPDILEIEKQKEIEKIKKLYSQKFEINVFSNEKSL